MPQVKVYGADWCGMTRRCLSHLDEVGVEYDYVDIDHDDQGCEFVKQHAGGKAKKPTLDIEGQVLVTPSNDQLDRVLRERSILT